MDFSQASLTAAAGVDPWGLRDKFAAGSPEAIYAMAKGFSSAAGKQGQAVTLSTKGLNLSGDGFQVDGASPIQIDAEVALAKQQLGDGGEKLGRIATLLSDVASDLAGRTTTAKNGVTTLEGDLNGIIGKWNSWVEGHPDATQADADAAMKGYFDQAVTAVRDAGKPLQRSVDDYESFLSKHVKSLADLGYVSAEGSSAAPDGSKDPGWMKGLWTFLSGDLANFWSGDHGEALPGSISAGLLRIYRTGSYLASGMDAAKFPTFNTGLAGKGLSALGSKVPFLADGAAWLQTPGATMTFRSLGAAGGLVSTGLDVKNLIDQGNPVDAFKRDGAGYVADLAKTGFSASTTAFMVAPNPVTAGLVIGTGAVWAGAEVVDHWDDITKWTGNTLDGAEHLAGDAVDGAKHLAGGAVDGAKHLAGGAVDGAKHLASSLNPFD